MPAWLSVGGMKVGPYNNLETRPKGCPISLGGKESDANGPPGQRGLVGAIEAAPEEEVVARVDAWWGRCMVAGSRGRGKCGVRVQGCK